MERSHSYLPPNPLAYRKALRNLTRDQLLEEIERLTAKKAVAHMGTHDTIDKMMRWVQEQIWKLDRSATYAASAPSEHEPESQEIESKSDAVEFQQPNINKMMDVRPVDLVIGQEKYIGSHQRSDTYQQSELWLSRNHIADVRDVSGVEIRASRSPFFSITKAWQQMTITRLFPIWVLLTSLLVAIALGSVLGRAFDERPVVATAAIAGGAALIAGIAVLELYDTYRRSRLRGYGPRIVVNFNAGKTLKRLIYGGLIVFAILSLFHSVLVGNLGAGFRMTTEDIRLVSTCPTHIRTHSEFIMREGLEEVGLQFAQLVEGQTAYERICEIGWDAQFN